MRFHAVYVERACACEHEGNDVAKFFLPFCLGQMDFFFVPFLTASWSVPMKPYNLFYMTSRYLTSSFSVATGKNWFPPQFFSLLHRPRISPFLIQDVALLFSEPLIFCCFFSFKYTSLYPLHAFNSFRRFFWVIVFLTLEDPGSSCFLCISETHRNITII